MNTNEKPVKNYNDVFRDFDEKKIQSNTKDIEEKSDNILQSRQNFTDATTTIKSPIETASTESTTTTELITKIPSITTLKPLNNFNLASDDTAENMQRELLARRRRRRRHRQRKYILNLSIDK